MLKDKYRFNLMFVEANSLKETISNTYEIHGKTKEVRLMLPLSILQEVQKRLIGSLAFPSEKMKFYLKRNEALAFHSMYMSGMIASTFVTSQINTEIHKTL